VPLTDGLGNPLLSGGDPLETAEFGTGDALWIKIVRWAIEQGISWIAANTFDWAGPPVDFGPLAGPVRYQRYHFVGFSATLQVSANGTDWTDTITVAFDGSALDNILALVDRLVDAVYAVSHAAVEAGAQLLAGGVLYAGEGFGMTSIAIGNVKKLIVEMRTFEQPLQLSFYFRRTDTASGSTGEADLIGGFRTNAEPALLDCMSADVTIDRYRVEDRISAGSTNGRLRTFVGETLVDVVGTGGAADTNNIPQAAGCLSWYTNFSGRGERGRTFVPGLPAAFVDDGRLTSAGVTAYQAFADALIAWADGDTDTADWQYVLWRAHLTGSGAADPNPITGHNPDGSPIYAVPPVTSPPFNPLAAAHGITLGIVQSTVRVQRRRGIGVRIGRRRSS